MEFKRLIKKRDYSKLPSSRKEQLNDILHTDFALIVDLSLLCALFAIPLIIVLFLQYTFILSLSTISFENVFPILLYVGLIAIIPFGILGLAKGASYNVLRKRIFNEGCILISAFFKSIKENGIRYFLTYALLGISYVITTCGILFFLYYTSNSFAKGFGIGILLLLFALTYCAATYLFNLTNSYVLSFSQALKNAYIFTLLSFIYSIVYFLLLAVFIVLISLNAYVAIVASIVYLCFIQGLYMLMASLFIANKFDVYINKENYPDYVNKGLNKEDQPCQN